MMDNLPLLFPICSLNQLTGPSGKLEISIKSSDSKKERCLILFLISWE